MISLIRLKRSMSTTSTACSRSRATFSPGALDRFGEGEAVGQAGQAVAQHLGAQRALGLDLDGAVDDAEQAARRGRPRPRGSGASLIRK